MRLVIHSIHIIGISRESTNSWNWLASATSGFSGYTYKACLLLCSGAPVAQGQQHLRLVTRRFCIQSLAGLRNFPLQFVYSPNIIHLDKIGYEVLSV